MVVTELITDQNEGSFYTNIIEVLPNTTYAVRGFSSTETENWFYDEKVYPIKSIGDCSNTVFTTPSNCKYIMLSGLLSEQQSLQLSDEQAPYEPYFPSNKVLEDERRKLCSDLMDIKMLGWAVPKEFSIKNYIQNNFFIQRVNRVSLYDLNWVYNQTAKRFETIISDKRWGFDNIYCSMFGVNADVYKHDDGVGIEVKKGISGDPSGYWIYIRSTQINLDNFKNAVNGEYLYYELQSKSYVEHRFDRGGEFIENIESRLKTLETKNIINLLIPTKESSTSNGITCTYNYDGTYTLTGTSTDITEIILGTAYDLIPYQRYKILGCPIYKGISLYSSNAKESDYGNGEVFLNTNKSASVGVYIDSNIPLNNVIIKPMITNALNATYDDFVPYTGNMNRTIKTLKSVLSNGVADRDVAMFYGIPESINSKYFYPLLGFKSLEGSWTLGSYANYFALNYISDLDYTDGSILRGRYVTINPPKNTCHIITSENIINNLTSTSRNSPLSAAQGKVLYDMIQTTKDYTSSITKSDNVQSLWSTNLTKNGHLVSFNVNITVNSYNNNRVVLGTLPSNCRPVNAVQINSISNKGSLCYMYIDTDGSFGIEKITENSWAGSDGIRTSVTYLV